jgi:hypothetical protein
MLKKKEIRNVPADFLTIQAAGGVGPSATGDDIEFQVGRFLIR